MAPEEIALPLDGLVLRRSRPAHAPLILAAIERSRPELRRFMPWAMEEPTLETVGAYLERAWLPPETFGFSLFDAGEVVGGFGLHGRRGPGILEIGYGVRSDRTGRGYATAAAETLADVGFGHFPDIHRLEIRCDPANAASAAVAAKLGFSLDARVAAEVEAVLVGRRSREAQTGVQLVWAATRAAWAAQPPSTWRPSAGRPVPPAGQRRR
jgi:RimJ/RimL family protein N-acetyltransferase